MSSDDNGNGRVRLADRLARIETSLDNLRADQADLRAYLVQVLDVQNTRLRQVELEHARQAGAVESLRSDVDALKKRSAMWDGLNSLGAFIAGVIGMTR